MTLNELLLHLDDIDEEECGLCEVMVRTADGKFAPLTADHIQLFEIDGYIELG